MSKTVSVFAESKPFVFAHNGKRVGAYNAASGLKNGETMQLVKGYTAILDSARFSWHETIDAAVADAKQMAEHESDRRGVSVSVVVR